MDYKRMNDDEHDATAQADAWDAALVSGSLERFERACVMAQAFDLGWHDVFTVCELGY